MATDGLSSRQASALLNILTHNEIYKEIRELRFSGALGHTGAPWKSDSSAINQLPLLQSLFEKCVTTLPGLRDISLNFWQAKCQVLVDDLAKSSLSESYEVGYIGIRKTFATAAAALLEAPSRGFFAGCSKQKLRHNVGNYDKNNCEDVLAAWDDFQQAVVYGDLIEEIFAQASQSDRLEDQSTLVQTTHEYILIVVASFLHYILIVSSEGHKILSMAKTANSLIPYRAIKSALKIGNAASMITTLSRIVLAKLSINTITSFIGLTNSNDGGMNLMQTIVSTMINWDTNELRLKAADIARPSSGLSTHQRELLDKYMDATTEERLKCQTMSEVKSEPLVVTIMEEYGGDELPAQQIGPAQSYLSLELTIRDRQKICDVLCSRQPDLLTQAVKEGIIAYEPIIRALHDAVDLSSTVGNVEQFLQDLFKLCLSNTNSKREPTVQDFVHLLRHHQSSAHSFIHQFCRNNSELSASYKEYAQRLAAEFRVPSPRGADRGAGVFTDDLEAAIAELPDLERTRILLECDAHADYLAELHVDAKKRLQKAIQVPEVICVPQAPRRTTSFQIMLGSSKAPSENIPAKRPKVIEAGPGVFLERWQAYIDDAPITPVTLGQPVRRGGGGLRSKVDDDHIGVSGLVGDTSIDVSRRPTAPVCERSIALLATAFQEMLRLAK